MATCDERLERLEGQMREVHAHVLPARIKDLYSIREASIRLQCSPYCLRGWVQAGRIKALTRPMGPRKRRMMIPLAELERFESEEFKPEEEIVAR